MKAPLSRQRISVWRETSLDAFLYSVVSRQHTSLIDEPELSLNIKWQRKLVPALLFNDGSQSNTTAYGNALNRTTVQLQRACHETIIWSRLGTMPEIPRRSVADLVAMYTYEPSLTDILR